MRGAVLPVLAALLAIATAQPPTDTSGSQYVNCLCSPGKRGFRVDVKDKLLDQVADLVRLQEDLTADENPTEEINEQVNAKSAEFWEDCISSYSYEECVNADSSLRGQKCAPNCASFCRYDTTTWKNVKSDSSALPACETIADLASEESDITSGSFPSNVLRTPPVPSPTSTPSPLTAGSSTPSVDPSSSASSSPSQTGASSSPSQAGASSSPSQAGASSSPSQAGASSTPSSTGTEKPLAAIPPGQIAPQSSSAEILAGRTTPGQTSTVPASQSATPPSPSSSTSSAAVDLMPTEEPTISPEPTTTAGQRVNEGCVAIEHLTGYVLQHAQHLKRNVLCSSGFCATPNHALIVRGKWTSMKRLCAGEWKCVRTSKLVNNLKISANTRAIVSEDIVVTPYDLRFPLWATWVVQIAEDALNIVGASVVVGGIAALALVFSVRMGKKA